MAGQPRAFLVATVLALLAACLMPKPSHAVSGWRDEAAGLVHFSGLRCPNRIASLTRTDTTSAFGDMLASCTYQSADIHAVIGIMEPNAVVRALHTLEQNYLSSGFPLVQGEAASSIGLTFAVGRIGSRELLETMWPIRVGGNDHILWVSHRHEVDRQEVDTLYDAVVQMLRAAQATR
ncbi:hypothetical protein [Breoghania sp. L-A4]|uniref:hypothetical protein n=1 Tax=Breoghania sp. L-A4 TaxID=2304600 RepID=UPI000E35F1B6|nr:hypothetical protein [Breoghania sp. L-A4]AXS41228.1 hypothetical protein D1F64_15845 [Breoghania sp. L-A4]